VTSGFQHYVAVPISVPVAVSVAVSVTVSVKNRVRTCRSVCRCWGVCAAVARQAQEAAGRRVSRAKEWAELQASWYVRNGRYRYGKIELDPR